MNPTNKFSFFLAVNVKTKLANEKKIRNFYEIVLFK